MHTVKQQMGMTSGHYILLSTRTANAGDGDPSYWEAMNSVLEDWVKTRKGEMGALAENDT